MDEQRGGRRDGGEDRRREVGADHPARAGRAVDVGCQPDAQDSEIDRYEQETRSRRPVDDIHPREQVENDEERDEADRRPRHSPRVDAACRDRDDDHEAEERIGRRRLHQHDGEQQLPRGNGEVVAKYHQRHGHDEQRPPGDDGGRRGSAVIQHGPERGGDQQQRKPAAHDQRDPDWRALQCGADPPVPCRWLGTDTHGPGSLAPGEGSARALERRPERAPQCLRWS